MPRKMKSRAAVAGSRPIPKGPEMQQSHEPLTIDPHDRPRSAPSASRGYLALWLVLAGAAMAYISALATRPDLVAAYLPDLRAEAGDTGARGVDVATMRATIAQLNEELAQVKTTAAASEARTAMLTSRVAELEAAQTNAAPAAVAAAPAAAAPAVVAEAPASVIARKFGDKPATDAKPVAEAKPAAIVPAVVAKAPVATADAAAQQIETGSIAATRTAAPAAPVSFGPAVVKPANQPYGLQLGRASTPDALRITWGLITEQNAATLKGLSPHYAAASDAADASLNLIAGPIKTKAEAVKTCNALAAKGINCRVAAFQGEAL